MNVERPATPADVSQRDQALLERFDLHKDFAKALLDAYVVITPDGRVLKFNQAFCAILAMKAVDVKKCRNMDDILCAQIPGSDPDVFATVANTKDTMRVDEVIAIRRHDGVYLQLIIGVYPYLDAEGQNLGVCAILRDVTAESNLQGKYQEKTLEAVTDPLSGLFTRRYFEEWIKKELIRCQRNDLLPQIGLLMFDLDKFKTVNDTYGHQAGDFVIASTAKILRDTSRKSDIIGRYGGEELIILLIGAHQTGACVAAEKLRTAVESHEYIFEGVRIPVTTSIGVTSWVHKNETAAEVIKRADECLYKAKKSGRNVAICDFGEGHVLAVDYIKEHPQPINTEQKSGG